jgi:hypothetical protein
MYAFAIWLKFNSAFFVIEVEIENPGHGLGFLRLRFSVKERYSFQSYCMFIELEKI